MNRATKRLHHQANRKLSDLYVLAQLDKWEAERAVKKKNLKQYKLNQRAVAVGLPKGSSEFEVETAEGREKKKARNSG